MRKAAQISLMVMLFALAFGGLQAQDKLNLFDFDNSLSFARFLEEQKSYELALREYERVDAMHPGKVDIRLSILRMYQLTNNATGGIVAFDKWDYHPENAPEELKSVYIGLHFRSRDFGRLERKLKAGMGLPEPVQARTMLHLHLYKEDWASAYSLWNKFEVQHVKETYETYLPVMDAISTIRYHHPSKGAALSLVPGLGQAYSKQYGAALGSLVMVGISSFGAYQFFKHKGSKNAFAWGFAGLGFTFYTANIIGGYKAARRYNQKQDEKIVGWLDGVTERSF